MKDQACDSKQVGILKSVYTADKSVNGAAAIEDTIKVILKLKIESP